MARKIYKHKGKSITRLPNGRHRIWIKDAAGKPYRPSFPTLEDAKGAIDHFLAQEARGERFLASAAHTTFDEALDLKRKELIDKGRDKATIDRFDSVRDVHLRPKFGHWKLSDFVDDRMETVKKWFEEKKAEGQAQSTMDHFKSDMNGAFECAIGDGKMAPPNPVLAFKVQVPYVEKQKRRPMPPEDIDAFVRAAMEIVGREQELAFYARQGMALVGLEIPLRTQDLCGLCWDCLNFDARIVFIRSVVKKVDRGDGKTVWALRPTTKTGESGKGDIHMSPVAHAWFSWWRDHLLKLELPTTGEVPVFRTKRVSLITPEEVQSNHMLKLVEKAGLIDERGKAKYTWYNLRHTVPSIWRAIGLQPDQIQDWMRHVDYATTKGTYQHRVPAYVEHYLPLVEEVMEELGLPNTPEGRVDALSIGRARLWQEAGIHMPCSLPKSLAQRRLSSAPELKALPGSTVIDMKPTAVTTDAPALAWPSAKKLKQLQVPEARRLAAPPHNWTRKRIADHLGICGSTLSAWLGSPDADRWMRQTSRAARADLDARCVAMLDRGDGSNEIARVLEVPHHWVMACARRHGRGLGSGKRRRRSRKMDAHEPRIRELIAEGKSDAAIAREIGEGHNTVNAFVRRRGLRHPSKGGEPRSKESAAHSAAQGADENAESRADSQTQSDHCTDSARTGLEDAAD